jgi:hypothetical protein
VLIVRVLPRFSPFRTESDAFWGDLGLEGRPRRVEKLRLPTRLEAESNEEVASWGLDGLGAAPVRVAPLDSERAQAVVLEEAELVTAKRTRVGRACDTELQRDAEPFGADAPFPDSQPRLSVRSSEDPARDPSRGHAGAHEKYGRLLSPVHVGADVQLRETQDRQAAETASLNVEGDDGDEEAAVHLCRREAGRKHIANACAAGLPAGDHEIADAKGGLHGQEAYG